MPWPLLYTKNNILHRSAAAVQSSTVALVENSANWDPRSVELSASNGKLTGEKFFVSDAAIADFLVVVARDGVFAVDSTARGLRIYSHCTEWI